jgi:hypothetical protein
MHIRTRPQKEEACLRWKAITTRVGYLPIDFLFKTGVSWSLAF